MRKAENLYTGAVLAEAAVLFGNSVLTIVWLWQLAAEHKMDILRGMILGTLVISCVLIPLESAALWFRYKQHGIGKGGAFQIRILQAVLPKLEAVFGALWLIHFASVAILADCNGWRQGSDIYMYFSRPGSRIIFLSLLGATVPLFLVRKYQEEQ